MHTRKTAVKPLMLSNGVSGEALSYLKTLASAACFVKELELGVYGVYAAGLSLFNLIECQMNLISHGITDIILSHKSFGGTGKPLTKILKRKTFPKQLEFFPKNFQIASLMPMLSTTETFHLTRNLHTWVICTLDSKMCWQTEHSLQILKCPDNDCYKTFKTNWFPTFCQLFLRYLAIPQVRSDRCRNCQAPGILPILKPTVHNSQPVITYEETTCCSW